MLRSNSLRQLQKINCIEESLRDDLMVAYIAMFSEKSRRDDLMIVEIKLTNDPDGNREQCV